MTVFGAIVAFYLMIGSIFVAYIFIVKKEETVEFIQRWKSEFCVSWSNKQVYTMWGFIILVFWFLFISGLFRRK